MTALMEFERLEAQGAWRADAASRLREVVVSVGDATLILSDPKSDVPLAHWSLPAVSRLNPGKRPAIYAPQSGGAGQDETVEIDDQMMIDAIDRVHRAIESRRGHPGRVRGGLTLFAVMAMLLIAFIWVPGALIRHAARIAPPAQAAQIGTLVRADMLRSTGAACSASQGMAVLDHLARKALPQDTDVTVLPAEIGGARALPGQIIVAGRDSISGGASADSLTGQLLAAHLVGTRDDPLLGALQYAGLRPVMTLLTTGTLPLSALVGYGQGLLNAPAPRPDDSALLTAFAEAGISSEPYARLLDPSGEATLGLIEADPFRTGDAPASVLSEEQWDALQRICDGA